MFGDAKATTSLLDWLPQHCDIVETGNESWQAQANSPLAVILGIPQSALDQFATEFGKRRDAELCRAIEAGFEDDIFRDLARNMLAALARPGQTSGFFTDHVVIHPDSPHRQIGSRTKPTRGGLALWQERKAKEMIAANLSGEIGLADLAKACRLSKSHFSQAFKQTVGYPPHQWRLQQRVKHAKHLLSTADLTLSEIALSAGFANQSHLTHVFSRQVGSSPAAWRRANAV